MDYTNVLSSIEHDTSFSTKILDLGFLQIMRGTGKMIVVKF